MNAHKVPKAFIRTIRQRPYKFGRTKQERGILWLRRAKIYLLREQNAEANRDSLKLLDEVEEQFWDGNRVR